MSLEKEFVQAEAQKRREIRFLHFLRLIPAVLARGVLSVLMFLWHFPGALARSVKKSVEAYFLEKSEGKPHSCSPKRLIYEHR
jgi:hypothetical protein